MTDVFVSALIIFASIKNSRAVYKTHLKWGALTFSRKNEKIFVWQIVFPGNYKKLSSFGKFGFFGQV